MTLETNREYYEAESKARLDYWRYMAAPRARVTRVVGEVRRLRPASLIDLGCGDGRLLEEISRALPGARLAGIDLSHSQIERNRAAEPSIDWRAADLQQPLDAGSTYEAIVTSEVIEHLEVPGALLRNAASLAAPAGWLVLTTQSGPLRETERRVGHVQHFSREDMWRMLEDCGWTPLRVWNEGFPFHDLSKWWANRDPDASMSRFGGERGYGFREKAICTALRAAFTMNSRSRGAQLYALARRKG